MKRQGGTFQHIGPTTVKLTTASLKVATPQVVQINYGDVIELNQLETLKTLRYNDNREMINPSKGVGNELFYEILYRLKSGIPFESLLSFLNAKWKDEDDAYFSFSEFDAARYMYIKFIESYHDEKEITEGIYTCPKCKSKETFSMSKQTRSADEPETTKVVCTNCTHSWRFN